MVAGGERERGELRQAQEGQEERGAPWGSWLRTECLERPGEHGLTGDDQ